MANKSQLLLTNSKSITPNLHSFMYIATFLLLYNSNNIAKINYFDKRIEQLPQHRYPLNGSAYEQYSDTLRIHLQTVNVTWFLNHFPR